jgi:hypothetical protein
MEHQKLWIRWRRITGLLSNTRQRLEEAEDREALLHTCEENADSRAENLSLQEAGVATREVEVRRRK